MTSLKYIFSKAQYKLSREGSVKMLKWLNPVRSSGDIRRAALSRGATTIYWDFLIVPRRNDAHSWATLLICCMSLNNSSAFFTCQAGSRLPVGDGHREQESSSVRPRLTLFHLTILQSAKHDPVTYRRNTKDCGSISAPFRWKSKPASVYRIAT